MLGFPPGSFGGRGPLDPSAVSPPAYVYRGSATGNDASQGLSASIDIGTASADRLVIVGTSARLASALTSVVVNGITLTIDKENNSAQAAVGMSSKLVTSGSGSQTVAVTWSAGASFQDKVLHVWTATGLASNTVKQTASATRLGGVGGAANIAVDAGDFMFADAYSETTTASFASSTVAPTANHDQTGAGGATFTRAADWIIASTNASFSVSTTNTVNITWAAVTYQ